MGEIDDSTVAGLTASLLRAFEESRHPGGGWQWAIDRWNSDSG